MQRIVERGPLSMTLLTHESTRRPVAIVVLYKGKATPDVVARFIAEARTASQLDSDHVARVYEVGALPDGAPFVAMEYVAGTDVGEMVSARGGPFQIAVAADVLLQAIDAIACARAHGVLHRDLRPGNLMLVSQGDGSEVLKVLNFDLSPASDVAAPLPNLFPLRRRLPPSHAYRAPERALDPSVVDPRADVWSLGALLFLLVTGAPPFAEGTPRPSGRDSATFPGRSPTPSCAVSSRTVTAGSLTWRSSPMRWCPTGPASAQGAPVAPAKRSPDRRRASTRRCPSR